MSEPEDDLETHDAHTAGNGSHLIPHPDEGHVRSDPELKALLEDMQRRYRVIHERLRDDYTTGISWFEVEHAIVGGAVRNYLAPPLYTLNSTA